MNSIQQVLQTVNLLKADGVIQDYAIGGAVGATFYLEPVATLDVDIFVAFQPDSNAGLISLKPIYDTLISRGCKIEGEYVMVAGWPVQFLPPNSPLVDEALAAAQTVQVAGVPARVFTAEHLAAIALQTGRAKDKARLLQFIEADVIDPAVFQRLLARHNLLDRWNKFEKQFSDAES